MKIKIMKTKGKAAALLTAALIGLTSPVLAQNVSISPTGNPPHNSAALDIRDFTNKGILIPRLTTAQRNAIPNPANSLLIFNTDCNVFQVYQTSTGKWHDIVMDPPLPAPTSFANSVTFNYTGAAQSWTV
jgi:hypothetical protein